MGQLDNDRFGEIALSLGFCTSEQIRRCLAIQTNTAENLSLGQSLMREGFISSEQHSQVLKRVRSSLKPSTQGSGNKTPPEPQEPPMIPGVPTAEDREDELLGKLAVREGWLTALELIALRAQAAKSPRRALADILVSQGYLTGPRAQELLGRVSRRAMCCRGCDKTYTVLSIVGSPEVACPRCRGPLREGQLPARPPAKDPLATQIFRVVSKSLRSPAAPGVVEPGDAPPNRGR